MSLRLQWRESVMTHDIPFLNGDDCNFESIERVKRSLHRCKCLMDVISDAQINNESMHQTLQIAATELKKARDLIDSIG